MRPFKPNVTYAALVLADAVAFAAFALLPGFEVVSSPAAASALELDGYGGIVAASHPALVAVNIAARVLLTVLLLLGKPAGAYLLLFTMLLAAVSAAIGGLSVFTALDMLALTLLYFLDGFLLHRTFVAARSMPREAGGDHSRDA